MFVIIYYIFAWEIENKIFVGEFFSSKKVFFLYNLFIFIVYVIVALKLLLICIRETKIILGTFSVSLFLINDENDYIYSSVMFVKK